MGIWFKHLIETTPLCLLSRAFWACPTGERMAIDPELTEGIICSVWPGNTFGSLNRESEREPSGVIYAMISKFTEDMYYLLKLNYFVLFLIIF